MESVRTAL